MNRRSIFALATLLLIGLCTTPVQAQTGGPGSQETVPQMGVHIVQRGDTLFSIARKYGLDACFECCLCGYYFVGRRPMLQYIRLAKEELSAMELAEEADSATCPAPGA